MRIVHVEDRFEPTAGYQINEMIKLHIENGNEVVVITSDRPIFSQLEHLLEQDAELMRKYSKLQIIRLQPKFVISSRYYFKGLFTLIDSLKPDILYLHGIADFKDLILLRPNKKYLIFRDCHMSWVASRNKLNKLFARFYRYTFSLLLNRTKQYQLVYSLGSEETEYLESLGIKEAKIGSLPHGFNREQMYYSHEQRQCIREQLRYSDEDIVVSYIGKFDHFKRPDIIFDIFDCIPEQLIRSKKIQLLFIGPFEPQYKDFFMKRLHEFKYQNLCTFLDKQAYQDLYKYYSAIDIALWPRECTLSALHAQVCNTAVVMENHKSNVERVYDPSHLFRIADEKHASEVLVHVIENYKAVQHNKKLQDFLEEREYNHQIVQLEHTWRRLLNGVHA